MRPRTVLILLAALIAALSLVAGGIQLAKTFAPGAKPLDLAPPILSVATALICIALLDWARNLPHRLRGGDGSAGDDEEEPLARRGE